MKTQEPSRSNSNRDNSNNQIAVVLNIMMTNTKVKVTLKMIYPKSINNKSISTGRKTNKHQTQKATPQKSPKKLKTISKTDLLSCRKSRTFAKTKRASLINPTRWAIVVVDFTLGLRHQNHFLT